MGHLTKKNKQQKMPEKKASVEGSKIETRKEETRLILSLEPLNSALSVCSSLELPSYLFGLC